MRVRTSHNGGRGKQAAAGDDEDVELDAAQLTRRSPRRLPFGAAGLVLAGPLTSAITRIAADLARARAAAGVAGDVGGAAAGSPPQGLIWFG